MQVEQTFFRLVLHKNVLVEKASCIFMYSPGALMHSFFSAGLSIYACLYFRLFCPLAMSVRNICFLVPIWWSLFYLKNTFRTKNWPSKNSWPVHLSMCKIYLYFLPSRQFHRPPRRPSQAFHICLIAYYGTVGYAP